MESEEEAVDLAKTMVEIGKMAGRKTIALITDMNEPLGSHVGNALEVAEAISVLEGNGDERLTTLSYTLASYMLWGAGYVASLEEAKRQVQEVVESKKALQKMAEFVACQGGDEQQVYQKERLPKAAYQEKIYLSQEGYLAACNTKEVGMASLVLGGGRETKESEIDLSVGIVLHYALGEYVTKEQPFATIYGNDKERLQQAKERLCNAYTVKQHRVSPQKLVKRVILPEDV